MQPDQEPQHSGGPKWCASCGGQMLMRNVKKNGPNFNRPFWGCSNSASGCKGFAWADGGSSTQPPPPPQQQVSYGSYTPTPMHPRMFLLPYQLEEFDRLWSRVATAKD
jgi:hypothetical protein